MIRTKLAALAAAVTLTLGGCATTGTNSLAGIETIIVADTQAACGFLPTASTVAGIVATLVPGALSIEQVAAQVASQICAAVAPLNASGRLGAAAGPPMVNGVVIHGRFVQ
jgi:hypothetical protein